MTALIVSLSLIAIFFQNCGEGFDTIANTGNFNSENENDTDDTNDSNEVQSSLLGLAITSTAAKQGSGIIFNFQLAEVKTAPVYWLQG